MLFNKEERPAPSKNEQTGATMTSIEIAEITGKEHKNVLQSIRGMESTWVKVTGLKFQLSNFTDPTGRKLPMYRLTRRECLYVATKYNDEARAKLIVRWEELEEKNLLESRARRASQAALGEKMIITVPMGKATNQIWVQDGIIYARLRPLLRYIGRCVKIGKSRFEAIGREHFLLIKANNVPTYFANFAGLNGVLQTGTAKLSAKTLREIYRMYGVPDSEHQMETRRASFPSMFSDEEMAWKGGSQ